MSTSLVCHPSRSACGHSQSKECCNLFRPFAPVLLKINVVSSACLFLRCCGRRCGHLWCRGACQRAAQGGVQEAHSQEGRIRPYACQELCPSGPCPLTTFCDKSLGQEFLGTLQRRNCCYKNVHWIFCILIYMLPIFRGIAP